MGPRIVSAAPFRSDRGLLAGHFPLQAFENTVDAFLKLFGVEAADRVLDHDHVRFLLPRLGLRLYQWPEDLGDDHHRDQPALP